MEKKTKKEGALCGCFKSLKKAKKPVKVLLALCLAATIAGGAFCGWKFYKTKDATNNTTVSTATVMRGNLVNTITGSGTVEPIEQREIVPEANGKILESSFKEGDSVKKGDILYKFEMTAAQNAIKTAKNNVSKAETTLSNKSRDIEKAKEDIEELTIVATASGKIEGLSLRVGEAAPDKICTITNYKEQTATVPFNSSQTDSISIGDSVTVAVDKYMMNISGTVERKYTTAYSLSNGAVVQNVEISLGGDYVIEENLNVTAVIHTSSGDIESASYGSVSYEEPVSVSLKSKGNVLKINAKNGDWIEKGSIIAVLENDDLTNALATAQQNYKDAEMNLTEAIGNLEDKEEAAKDYIVESPIDGVILTKEYNVGDTINGQNAPTMMVVADMSKMKFTISADELDISKIKLGQNVQVTADALEGQQLQGIITNVSKLGTASNGVTNYPIEVTIESPGELMPGMNVNAEIIVEQAYDTLYVPIEAVEYFGGKYYVTVVGEVENMPRIPSFEKEKVNPQNPTESQGISEKEKTDEKQPEEGENLERPVPPDGVPSDKMNIERPDTGERPVGEGFEKTEKNKEQTQKYTEASRSENKTAEPQEGKIPSGNETEMGQSTKREEIKIKYLEKEERTEVTVGIVTDEYYEIKGGVEFGQVVKTTGRTTGNTGMMGGMPGGMMGGMPGGMPGGMAGGMPNRGSAGGGMSGGMRGGR